MEPNALAPLTKAEILFEECCREYWHAPRGRYDRSQPTRAPRAHPSSRAARRRSLDVTPLTDCPVTFGNGDCSRLRITPALHVCPSSASASTAEPLNTCTTSSSGFILRLRQAMPRLTQLAPAWRRPTSASAVPPPPAHHRDADAGGGLGERALEHLLDKRGLLDAALSRFFPQALVGLC